MSRYVLEDEKGEAQGRYVLEDAPASVQAGRNINSIPRQIGLTARYGLEGLANTAQLFTEPIRQLVTDPLSRAMGMSGQSRPLGQEATALADRIGLPAPVNANERVIGDATRLGFGTLGMAGAAQAAGGKATEALQFMGRNVPGAVQSAGQRVAQSLADKPGRQVVAAATGGAAGGASREAGGSPLYQGLAAVGGTVVGGLGADGAAHLANRGAATLRNLIPAQRAQFEQRLDQRINIILQNQGIDLATVTPAMRNALREQVGRAMDMGDLNPEAVARLADYTRLGMTPTRARLTLDPYDITQEANASKLAAATGARDARLPQIAQENNARLVGRLDDMGGSRPYDAYGQGGAAIRSIQSQDDRLASGVDTLYSRAREMAGGDIPLDRKPFVDNIFAELARSGKLSFAPENIMGRINQISGGVVRANGQDFEVPFTAQTIDELKTMVATAQRATNDGNVSASLSAIRRALDATPISPVKNTFGGNQVVTGAGGDFLRNQDAMPDQFMDALNQARAAAAGRFNWRETAGPIDRAVSGAIPDTFIQQNIISKAAGFDGVAQAARTINSDPSAREAVRTAIVQHLKDSAIGKGGTSQTGNFSGRGMEAALKDIGDRKLGLFFEPAEVETLKAMARTGSFEVFQPRGSAVNNSNSAAGIGSILAGIADRVRPVASKIPFGQAAIVAPLENSAASAMQWQAQNVPRGLLSLDPMQKPAGAGLLLPALAFGGLLAAPGSNPRY